MLRRSRVFSRTVDPSTPSVPSVRFWIASSPHIPERSGRLHVTSMVNSTFARPFCMSSLLLGGLRRSHNGLSRYSRVNASLHLSSSSKTGPMSLNLPVSKLAETLELLSVSGDTRGRLLPRKRRSPLLPAPLLYVTVRLALDAWLPSDVFFRSPLLKF